jgi:hypothetical protein
MEVGVEAAVSHETVRIGTTWLGHGGEGVAEAGGVRCGRKETCEEEWEVRAFGGTSAASYPYRPSSGRSADFEEEWEVRAFGGWGGTYR